MADELTIIPSTMLTDVSEEEINSLIEKVVEDSKGNLDELSELTLECTSLLTSAESRSTALSEQGVIKRIIGGITGKNDRLRNAILKDNTNALYAAQQAINCVMAECTNNRKLLLAVNDRISDVYLELKENQNDLAESVLMVRKAIVAFYSQYKEELLAQEERISSVETSLKQRCQNCNAEIPIWEVVCPYCGEIHSLKKKELSSEAMSTLEKLSKVVKDDTGYEDIIWSEIAKKKARVLRKVKLMGELGKIPGYTNEIIHDIDGLINKCMYEEFQIAIVGVMKAGKSYLMNALMGKEIASVDVNPETAALTKFRATSGYYIRVKFHREKEWKKFRKSVEQSSKAGENSLKGIIGRSEISKLEKKFVNSKDLVINCTDIEELRDKVKKYTSAEDVEHLFVSEVEVGVDTSVFNMPKEVVFVDTPGLQDPVKYRSDITRDYIQKADAVLIAVPTKPLTAEGNTIITTVLDCTDVNKAYIIATQKDSQTDEECDRIIKLWIEHLVNARRYPSENAARGKILLTSAKMDLLLQKWMMLEDDKRDDEQYFSNKDFNSLEDYVKDILNTRRYDMWKLPDDEGTISKVKLNTGIEILRKRLDSTLINKHKELKIAGIEDDFNRCKTQIKKICATAIKNEQKEINMAEKSAEELKHQLEIERAEQHSIGQANEEIKIAAEKLEKEIGRVIAGLERKGR